MAYEMRISDWSSDVCSSDLRVEEIIVTARRTEENLQTTPVAVTAISAAGLERAQINDVVAVQRAAPNLTITSGTPAASGFAIISMRGQANLNAGNASDRKSTRLNSSH